VAVDPSASIHSSTVVEVGAVIGPGCRIGPFCAVGPDVVLEAGVTLHSHVALGGITRIGEGTTIWPFASLGHAPQDLKYRGERTELIIGARNMIREYVTISPGTVGGGGLTRVGNDSLFMMHSHVGHDCVVGNQVVLANCATLAGHVTVEDGVILGGLSAVHQFVRIGTGAMIGGLAGVVADVIPFGMVAGERAQLIGLNLVGLKRRQVERSTLTGFRAAYATIAEGEGTFVERLSRAAEAHPDNPLLAEVLRFAASESARSYTMPPRRGNG
jgi:UDP-N-acetylglucosamine acyltransferase